LSEESGSWNTIAMRSPRMARSSRSVRPTSSSPASRMLPVTCPPRGTSPITASEVMDLPEPDSPTMPRVLSGSTRNDRSSTTRTGPREVGKAMVSPSTSSSGVPGTARAGGWCGAVAVTR
jgi:hypothetical protein